MNEDLVKLYRAMLGPGKINHVYVYNDSITKVLVDVPLGDESYFFYWHEGNLNHASRYYD